MPTVVDLEESVPVPAVAHDVVSCVGAGTTGLLGGDRGEQARIEAVTAGRALDLRRECDARAGESGGNWVEAHGTPLSPRPLRLTRSGAGSRMAKSWRPCLLAGPHAAAGLTYGAFAQG
jgi:hypothetical protein